MGSVQTNDVRRSLQDVYREVAELFTGRARETLLFENEGKHLYELQHLIRLLHAGSRVLDIGGGMGVNLLVLSKLVSECELHIIDRFSEYDESNKMGAPEGGLRLLKDAGVAVVIQDFWGIPTLPYDDMVFDVVSCLSVVEHLPGHPLQLLREAHRVLKGNGVFMFAVPNAASLVKRVKLLFGKHPYTPLNLWCQEEYFSHYREYTPDECVLLLERSGFRDVSVRMVAEPARTRVRKNFWKGVRSGCSPQSIIVRIGLKAESFAETLLPSMRSITYCFGKRPE